MILIQDCREKRNKHNNIEFFCKENNIEIVRKKLDVGDYMFPCGKISVDIKQNCEELANDLYRDMKNLNKKYRKCYEQKIQLWVLIEEKVSNIEELSQWKSKHSRIDGRLLINMIHRLRVSYGIRFKFASKEESPKILLQILNGNMR